MADGYSASNETTTQQAQQTSFTFGDAGKVVFGDDSQISAPPVSTVTLIIAGVVTLAALAFLVRR